MSQQKLSAAALKRNETLKGINFNHVEYKKTIISKHFQLIFDNYFVLKRNNVRYWNSNSDFISNVWELNSFGEEDRILNVIY